MQVNKEYCLAKTLIVVLKIMISTTHFRSLHSEYRTHYYCKISELIFNFRFDSRWNQILILNFSCSGNEQNAVLNFATQYAMPQEFSKVLQWRIERLNKMQNNRMLIYRQIEIQFENVKNKQKYYGILLHKNITVNTNSIRSDMKY